jgi:hypothetical protein
MILSIFSILKDWTATAIGSLLMLVLSWIAAKYLPSLLNTERKKRMAEYILKIAEDVIGFYLEKYPNDPYASWLDMAIARLMEICGIERDIAERVLKAAIERKKLK